MPDQYIEVPDHWYSAETSMYVDLVGGVPQIADDSALQLLFHEALFDMELSPHQREGVLQELERYLWEEYDINFDDVFDWEAYREWYG
jgi:hypothetical protein